MFHFILVYLYRQLTAMLNKNFPNCEPKLAEKSKVIISSENM
jgi:hypothetical protein